MSIDFNLSLARGNFGEKIVAQTCANKGFLTTRWDQDCSHSFDKFLVKKENGKVVALFDVKTKPLRNKYQDTGINLKSFNDYIDVSKINNLPFLLFFVDEVKNEIYFQSLHKLRIERMVDGVRYPKIESFKKQIIYFHYSSFLVCGKISENASRLIRQSNQRSYPYVDEIKTSTSSVISIETQTERWIADAIKQTITSCP